MNRGGSSREGVICAPAVPRNLRRRSIGYRHVGALRCKTRAVLRLRATDTSVVLSRAELDRALYPLMEFLPTSKIKVRNGPGLQIIVRDRSPADLMPAILQAVERTVGCAMVVDDGGE